MTAINKIIIGLRQAIAWAKCEPGAAEPRIVMPPQPTTAQPWITARQVRYLLAKDYPNLFFPERSKRPRKPLMLGLKHALVADGFTERHGIHLKALNACLRDYTSGPRYITAVAQGDVRYDLQGQPCGEITEANREHAKAQLARFPEAWIKSMKVRA